MYVAIVGAGALGRVFGVRLAAAGADVSFVVRQARAEESGPFSIEQASGHKRKDVLEAPRRVTAIPREATIALVAVRFDQLLPGSEAVLRLHEARSQLLVFLTPLFPATQASLEAELGRKIFPAMPGVAGYLDDRGVARYWTTPVATTLIEEPGHARSDDARRTTLEELARRLTKAGLAARLEPHVAGMNAATTVSFFPLIAAIDAGGIDAVLADKELFSTALEAARETAELAKKLGKVAPWAHLLTRFVGPYTIKPGIALGRRLVPEAVRFVETHFGAKLHAQHLAMGEAILRIGREVGTPLPSLEKLLHVLRERGGDAPPRPSAAP